MAIILLVTYLFLPQWNHMVIWGSPYLNTLSEVAAARGPAVTAGAFLAGAHRELRVAFIKFKGPCIVVVPTSWQGLRAVRCHQG